MREQIDCAADHGIRFFAFDWYYPEGGDKTTPINNALDLYLKAPNRNRMEFCIMATNHSGFRIGPADWDACCKIWLTYFKSTLYVRANGAPLLIIFSPQELTRSFGGTQEVRKAFEKLRAMAVQEGLPGVSIAGCWSGRNIDALNTLPEQDVEAGYTFATGYAMSNECGWDWPKRDQPFSYLIDGNKKAWDVISSVTHLPYIPVATLGWDMRPWEKSDLPPDKQAIRFLGRTPEGVRSMVSGAKQWISNNKERTAMEKILLLYAWNEYGEGAYLTPTAEEGPSYLDAVKDGLDSPGKPSPEFQKSRIQEPSGNTLP